MHIEWRRKGSANSIVDSCKVGPVGNVESFRRESQAALLTQFDGVAQAHVEGHEIWSQAAVTRSPGRTVVREVIVTVDIGPS